MCALENFLSHHHNIHEKHDVSNRSNRIYMKLVMTIFRLTTMINKNCHRINGEQQDVQSMIEETEEKILSDASPLQKQESFR